nr:putative ribonuclease H-like domain-containing protein [Tanacetum cinerariifolium]
QDDKKKELEQEYILIPICTTDPLLCQGSKDSVVDAGKKAPKVDESKALDNDGKNDQVSRNDTGIFCNAYDDEVLEEEVDMNNVDSSYIILEATKNKKDERGIAKKNKARLVSQGHTQEEGIDYDEVYVPVARIEAIRLFLAYDSFKDFIIYQMDVKSAFLYGRIEEEVYVCQPPGFEDPNFPDKVYKVEKALYGLHQALRACQDKYAAKALKKFDFVNVKTASTPMKSNKPLIKDEEAEDVDVHLYRSMIGSLMYLTASRPDVQTSSAGATYQLSSRNTSSLAVGKYSSSRIFITGSGNDLSILFPTILP